MEHQALLKGAFNIRDVPKSFSQSCIFQSVKISADFLWRTLVWFLWNSMGISVPAHIQRALEAQRLPGLGFRAVQ